MLSINDIDSVGKELLKNNNPYAQSFWKIFIIPNNAFKYLFIQFFISEIINFINIDKFPFLLNIWNTIDYHLYSWKNIPFIINSSENEFKDNSNFKILIAVENDLKNNEQLLNKYYSFLNYAMTFLG